MTYKIKDEHKKFFDKPGHAVVDIDVDKPIKILESEQVGRYDTFVKYTTIYGEEQIGYLDRDRLVEIDENE